MIASADVGLIDERDRAAAREHYEEYYRLRGGRTLDGKRELPSWEEIEARYPSIARAFRDLARSFAAL